MAMCKNCGTDFEGKFCPSCGTPSSEIMSDLPEIKADTNNNSQNNGGYNPPPVYNAPPVYNNVSVIQPDNTTGVGGWIGWLLLCSLLPIIGQIIMIGCSQDRSAKNFAKAQLIFTLIGVIILVVIILIPLFIGGIASNM